MKQTTVMTIAASMAIAVGVGQAAAYAPDTRPPLSAASTAVPALKGNVLYSQGWTEDSQPIGMYHIPTSPSETFEEIYTAYLGTFGNFEQDGYYFTTERVRDNDSYIVAHTVWDAISGSFVNSFMTEGDCSQVAVDCAKDPSSGFIYAATFNPEGNGYQLSVLNFTRSSAMVLKIGDFDCEIAALGCTAQGQLYAISRERNGFGAVTGSTLLMVDKSDASYRRIGTGTGCMPQYNSSATIDPASGRMFWTVCPPDNSGSLYEVNLQTGTTTLIYDFPGNEQVVGLALAGETASAKAPAQPTNLQLTFTGGSLNGILSCDIPATTFDGQSASGSLTYTVSVDGEEFARGTTTYGGRINQPVTVSRSGTHSFAVFTTNQNGDSPKATASKFVGYGIPEAPAGVTAALSGTSVSVDWTPVTTTVDGGYINPADVLYRVMKQDGTTVADALKSTSYTETISLPDSPETLTYTVVAVSGGYDSDPAYSNTIALGSVTPPYSTVFSDGSHTLNAYTVIDANNDGRTWIWDDKGNGLRAPYNTDHVTPMDDWLITPGLVLQSGHTYELSFDASVIDATYSETFEVRMGSMNTAEAMTVSLIPETTISNTEPKTMTASIVAPSDGIFYVGIHCISEADRYYLYVDNLRIGAAQANAMPGQPDNYTVTPTRDGTYSAKIDLKAPSKTISGETLASLDKVTIERDGEVIKTFDAPAPGQQLSYTDMPGKAGKYTYTAAAYSDGIRGTEVSVETVIGIDIPAAPKSVKLVETSNPGEVTASWLPVNTDCNGIAIPAGKVVYDLYILDGFFGEWRTVAESMTETSHTFRITDDTEEQQFAYISVRARSENGSSEAGESDFVAIGDPYTVIRESAPNGWLSHIWAMDGTIAAIGTFRDNTIMSCSSADGDNGYFYMRGNELYQTGYLQSGKLDLTGAANPGLTFYTYNFVGSDGDPDTNPIVVSVKTDGGDFKPVLSTTVAELAYYSPVAEWVKCHVSLDEYAGKTVEFRISGTITSFSYVMIDNIYAGDLPEKDLAVAGISAPSRILCGSDYKIEVTVVNNGLKTAEGWSVDLYEADEVVATIEGRTLLPDSKNNIVFNMTMSPVVDMAAEYHAVVNFAGDEHPDNNMSDAVTVAPIISHHPRATGLNATEAEGGVSLAWTAPELPDTPQTVNENFSNADSFAHDYADWTFTDLDNIAAGGFNEFEIPGINKTETVTSFFVFDPVALGLGSQFAPHSGSKFLASILLWDHSEVNDWAISPELSGNAQTISFYARSFQSAYPEKLEILYSDGSLNPSQFKVAKAASEVPEAWTLYKAELPAGAKRFAIRSCASTNFMLLVDDITYEASPLADRYHISGYNIYRNGVKINDAPVAQTNYLDSKAEESNTYVVTTVYDCGESAPSNSAYAEYSGITVISNDADNSEAVYYNLQGIKVTRPASGQIYIRCRNGKSDKVLIK